MRFSGDMAEHVIQNRAWHRGENFSSEITASFRAGLRNCLGDFSRKLLRRSVNGPRLLSATNRHSERSEVPFSIALFAMNLS
jgi:hypothetical protein